MRKRGASEMDHFRNIALGRVKAIGGQQRSILGDLACHRVDAILIKILPDYKNRRF
jgi:hypothetical protein